MNFNFSIKQQEDAIALEMLKKANEMYPEIPSITVKFSLDTNQFTINGLSEEQVRYLLNS